METQVSRWKRSGLFFVRSFGAFLVLSAVNQFGPIMFGEWPFWAALVGLFFFSWGMK